MKQKVENLGFLLPKNAQKKILGGNIEDETTQCYECTAGAKEWGFGCPSPLRSDCKCEKCQGLIYKNFHNQK